MNQVLNYLWEFRFAIVIIAALAGYALFEWQDFKAKAYALMLQAKSLAKDAVLKNGDQQAEWVVRKAYQYLPKSITVFLSEEAMRKVVKWLYDKGKDYLDDGQFNNSQLTVDGLVEDDTEAARVLAKQQNNILAPRD